MDESEELATNFKALNTLQMAFAGGMLMFATVVFVLTSKDQRAPNWSDPLTITAAIFAIGSVPVSLLLFKTSLQKAQSESELIDKIAIYRMAFIRRTAVLDGAVLFSIILVFLSHCMIYYAITAIPLMTFFSQWITLDKMQRDLAI